MKRDMDLLRSILLHHEEHSDHNWVHTITPEDFPDYDMQLIESHVRQLELARYLNEVDQTMGSTEVDMGGITPEGYDFLDSVRDPEIWRKTKNAGEKAGGWTLELLSEIAKGLLKTQIEKFSGVKI